MFLIFTSTIHHDMEEIMLKKIQTNRKISKEEFKSRKEDLFIKIGQLQRKTRDLNIPLIIIFEGVDGAGKGTLINNLLLPMDARGIKVEQTLAPNEEEKMRPFLWRFWTKTPANGRISIFDRSWYARLVENKLNDKIKKKQLFLNYEEIESFERQLTDSGTVILKYFLHVDKKEQKKRFKKLEKNKSTKWRITKEDWKNHKRYDDYIEEFDRMIERTDFDFSPWTIVEAGDERFATIKIYESIIQFLEEKISKLQTKNNHSPSLIQNLIEPALRSSVLDSIDLSKSLTKENYKSEIKKLQKRIHELEHELYIKRIPLIIAYEGWDAAGKGGNIRRIVEKMDPRGYEVIPIAAPNDIEKEHHYLWRFWKYFPKAGHIAIFDRTWYGRVLVERIEGFCTKEEWQRAYNEINEMERHLANFGTVVCKFWLEISKEEQLSRFKQREVTEHKKWKITEEDWRNREKWEEYRCAVDEMLIRTSTTNAPWTVVESNSKYYARIKALKTVIERCEEKL